MNFQSLEPCVREFHILLLPAWPDNTAVESVYRAGKNERRKVTPASRQKGSIKQ